MGEHNEKQQPKQAKIMRVRRSYDTDFKITVVHAAEETNKCAQPTATVKTNSYVHIRMKGI